MSVVSQTDQHIWTLRIMERQIKRRALAKPREFSSDGQRKTLSFRCRGGLYEQLVERALQEEMSISEVIETGLAESFAATHDVAEERNVAAMLRDQLAEYATNPHEAAAVKAFAFGLRKMQSQRGASWREGGGLGYVVGAAVGQFMARHTRYPMAEGLQNIASGRDLDVEAEDLANVLETALGLKVPPLLEVNINPFSLTDHVRHVVRIKDKATGAVLETLVMREGRAADLGKAPLSPAFLEAVDRYRPRRHELDTEVAIEQVVQGNHSVWEVEAPAPAAYLVGQEEAAKWVPAELNRPPEIFQRADMDEVWRDPPRDDDGERGRNDGDPGEASPAGERSAAAPAPRRGRRAKVKA